MTQAKAALLFVVSLLASLAFSSFRDLQAQGYEGGEGWSLEWVLPGCLSALQGRRDYRAGVCLGIVMAVVDMRSVSVVTLQRRSLPLSERQRMAREAICEPRSATDLDSIRIVIAYARQGIADRTIANPAGVMFSATAYSALKAGWPCEIPVE